MGRVICPTEKSKGVELINPLTTAALVASERENRYLQGWGILGDLASGPEDYYQDGRAFTDIPYGAHLGDAYLGIWKWT